MWYQAAQEGLALFPGRAGLVEQSYKILTTLLFVGGIELPRDDRFTDAHGRPPVSNTESAVDGPVGPTITTIVPVMRAGNSPLADIAVISGAAYSLQAQSTGLAAMSSSLAAHR
jgi:hypothetical protein